MAVRVESQAYFLGIPLPFAHSITEYKEPDRKIKHGSIRKNRVLPVEDGVDIIFGWQAKGPEVDLHPKVKANGGEFDTEVGVSSNNITVFMNRKSLNFYTREAIVESGIPPFLGRRYKISKVA